MASAVSEAAGHGNPPPAPVSDRRRFRAANSTGTAGVALFPYFLYQQSRGAAEEPRNGNSSSPHGNRS